MPLTNYVVLKTGEPERMHFVDHELAIRTIVDPVSRREKGINVLVFTVDELGAQKVVGYYSVTSQKHSADFDPYLPGKRYKDFTFVITALGEGFRREYQVQAIGR